ncbi:MAG: hypothetical protein ACLPZR_10935, partial [Solirubrobacteraceae bacterium]
DELPEALRTPEGRRTFFREAKQRLTMKASEGQGGEREELAGSAEVPGGLTDTPRRAIPHRRTRWVAGRSARRRRAASRRSTSQSTTGVA